MGPNRAAASSQGWKLGFEGRRTPSNLLTESLPPGRLLTRAFWLNVYFAIYACAIFSPLEKEENRFLKMLPTLQMNSYFPAP